jgi:ABC-type hemin transport system substrate-binding protein
MILISFSPVYSVSGRTFLGDMLVKAGFENAVQSPVRYPAIGQEELIKLRPDIIFVSERFQKEGPAILELFRRIGQKPELVFIDEDRLNRPGPRAFDVVREMAEAGEKIKD